MPSERGLVELDFKTTHFVFEKACRYIEVMILLGYLLPPDSLTSNQFTVSPMILDAVVGSSLFFRSQLLCFGFFPPLAVPEVKVVDRIGKIYCFLICVVLTVLSPSI